MVPLRRANCDIPAGRSGAERPDNPNRATHERQRALRPKSPLLDRGGAEWGRVSGHGSETGGETPGELQVIAKKARYDEKSPRSMRGLGR